MTIIRPQKLFSWHNLFFGGVIMLFILALLGWVALYNRVVNLTHEIDRQAKTLKDIQVANAELKNSLFQKLDAGKLETLARERNLVKERAPHYFETDQKWAVALQ